MPRKKQHHIVINEDSGLLETIESYKSKLNLKSKEEVIAHFLPKTNEEYFDHEWQVFKELILNAIPNSNGRQDFLFTLEALFFVGIVNGNKVSLEFIEDFKERFGE